MPKCDFNKVAKQLHRGCSPVNLRHYFRSLFLRTPLEDCFWIQINASLANKRFERSSVNIYNIIYIYNPLYLDISLKLL